MQQVTTFHAYFWALMLFSLSLFAQEEDKPKNLGKTVNSVSTDAEPKISPDGKTLYFCRRQDSANVGGYNADADIWYAELLPSGEWSAAKNPREPLNDEGFNQVIGIRSDGHAMLINGGYDTDADTRIYVSYKTEKGWSSPEPMFFDGFSASEAGDQNFAISGDFQTLIISMEWGETYGQFDLFISFWDAQKHRWTKPKNLGTRLNTTQSEVFPVLANDNRTIYFSSRGHDGYGDYDIFMSKRLGGDWRTWTSPVNLGNTINSAGYDADFTVDARAEYAYISRDTDTFGRFDIFKVKMPDEIKPNPVALLSGEIFNKETDQSVAEKITYFDAYGKKMGKVNSIAGGKYSITLECGKKYRLVAGGTRYLEEEKWIDLTKNTAYIELKQDFQLPPNPNPVTTLASPVHAAAENGTKKMEETSSQMVFFGTGYTSVAPRYYSTLNNIVQKLQKNTTQKIAIYGHTDHIGQSQKNQQLSLERAQSVADYLIKKGIAKNRIEVKGLGAGEPIASNDSVNGRAKNRRVELILK